MRRLHLKIFLAIVGALIAFAILSGAVWHIAASVRGAVPGIETATLFSARLLDQGEASPDYARSIVHALARQIDADAALFDRDGALLVESHHFDFTVEQRTTLGWTIPSGPTFAVALDGGRVLVVHPRHRFLLHGLHIMLLLVVIAGVLALLTYPVVRGITARLARLEAGVRRFGGGDLSARVDITGRDEVATLARSFNHSADRIERLVRANQMLLANCSHELRTPLTRLRLATERLPQADPAITEELRRNVAELDALIGELLLTSRLDAAPRLERVEPVDLLALTAEEAAQFDREATGESFAIAGDPTLLRRLVRNLLANARVHAGGATAIRVRRDAAAARIEIEDAGEGVAPEERDKLFEPFFRGRGANTSSGAGLGLAIVRQIARVHGGDVTYEARTEGGSRFVVALPLEPQSMP
jgi:signal transduction histidine kinase